MALNTTKLGPSGVNSLFKLYYGRDATKDELNYWSNKSDAELRPKLIPNSAVQLVKNKPSAKISSPAVAAKPVVTADSKNLNTTPLGAGGVNALFKLYYGRDATSDELNYWSNKSDAQLRPKLIPNSAAQLAKNKGTQAAPIVEDQTSVDKKYAEAAAANPAIATLAKGGSTLEEIINGLSTGDISGLLDWQGKPFSVEDQQAALAQGMEDNRLYYEAMQAKDQADAESAMAKKQADYQDYLIQSGQQFQADKDTADQNAAEQGVLFSGSRVQKEKNLARAYAQDQATNQRNFATSIGDTARDFQYKYGNAAATGLNKYYNLGSNTYDASKAQGGVASAGLSAIYNPSSYNFQGTKNTERQANANTRAAGYLWNKGNKLLATGYTNQY